MRFPSLSSLGLDLPRDEPPKTRTVDLAVEYARRHNQWVCAQAFDDVAAKLRDLTPEEAEGVLAAALRDPEATERQRSAALMLRSVLRAFERPEGRGEEQR